VPLVVVIISAIVIITCLVKRNRKFTSMN
jgi:hypothetical protein